ncbi:hypothetical protein [Amycolatopsis palatopharyngis]|uniref:hypothetical protein n=1 Tax=Amycolatopsis palatopharyngis TaxID=187982 RepID=UPI000E25010B|nr:hypothetical protein [Amycolatopsis palatopharyngis]
MSEDIYRDVGGVREPDPTLGKNLSRLPEPPTEQIPAVPSEPEPPPKVRRKKVVLADPRQQSHTLRARVELEEQTSWGELLIKDLVKVQLRASLWLAVLVLGGLGSLPLAFYFSPTLAGVTFIGVPVSWLLLGVAPFPLLFGVGLWYNRLAERYERDFVDMIEN